jgi:predicted RNA polymerase sigma factor
LAIRILITCCAPGSTSKSKNELPFRRWFSGNSGVTENPIAAAFVVSRAANSKNISIVIADLVDIVTLAFIILFSGAVRLHTLLQT